jgi:hypothetical protein
MTRDAGHRRTWGPTKTNVSSALVRSVAGTAGVTAVCGLCAGTGENGRVVINIVNARRGNLGGGICLVMGKPHISPYKDLRGSSIFQSYKDLKGCRPTYRRHLSQVGINVPFIGVFFQAVWLGIDIGGKCVPERGRLVRRNGCS